jgi:hypothetical protein
LKVIHQTTNQLDIQGDKMSDYKDGFDDGYKFAREEIMEKLAEIDIMDIDSWILDRISEMIEGGKI